MKIKWYPGLGDDAFFLKIFFTLHMYKHMEAPQKPRSRYFQHPSRLPHSSPRAAIILIAILCITFVYMIGQDEEDLERGKGG